MLYTSLKEEVKRKLAGIDCEIQATDRSECSQEEIMDKLERVLFYTN